MKLIEILALGSVIIFVPACIIIFNFISQQINHIFDLRFSPEITRFSSFVIGMALGITLTKMLYKIITGTEVDQ